MHRVDDPVDARVAADRLVLRVHQNHLIVLVSRVLVNPVRVQHTQIGTPTANALLGRRSQRSLVLELVHALVRWLA